MRILLIGDHHSWRPDRGVERALRRAGHQTLLVDDRRLRRRIGRTLTQRWTLRAARRFRPDFVFLSQCLGLDHETVAELVRGRESVLWYHDAAYFDRAHVPNIARTIEAGRLADVFFVTGFESEWGALGLRAKFLPAAADRDIVPVPPRPEYAADVVFTGTGYDAGRAEFLIALARHCRVKVWGLRWEPWRDQLDWGGRRVEGREFAAVCSSSAISLGILPAVMKHATNAASNRMWMTVLAGGFYLGHGTPGVDRMLLDAVHCAWYTDFDSCVTQVERYLARPAERERVRSAGEAFVRAHHTFDQRIHNLLSGREWVNPL